METELSLRLRGYATADTTPADIPSPARVALFADALRCTEASTAAASALVICSHTRILRGDSPPTDLPPGQDELDLLIADKKAPAAEPAPTNGDHAEDLSQAPRLTLRTGNGTLDKLALGAAAIPAVKSHDA